ncbi:MAG: hypothetical protein ACXQTZ_02620 [Candidatus Alkanophagales archaeon]
MRGVGPSCPMETSMRPVDRRYVAWGHAAAFRRFGGCGRLREARCVLASVLGSGVRRSVEGERRLEEKGGVRRTSQPPGV